MSQKYFNQITKLCKIVCLLFAQFAYGSEIDLGDVLKEPVRTRPIVNASQMQLLQDDELNTLQVITPGLSDQDLETIRNSNSRQLALLVETHTQCQESRTLKMKSWRNFHDCFAGKSKGAGYVIMGLASVGWIASLALSQPEVKYWLMFGSTLFGGCGGFFIYLGGKSQEAGLRLESAFIAGISRAQHTQTIYDAEHNKRQQRKPDHLLAEASEQYPLIRGLD